MVTLDLDFADIRTYPPAEYAGIIVFRLRLLDKFHVLLVLERLLPVLATRAARRQAVDRR